MAVTQDKSAPYAPAKALLSIIERYRSRGLPQPVNAEALARIGVTESLIPRTLQALQVLDLVDEVGTPTETLEGIRLAPEAEFKKRLEAWLKGAYADVFAIVDPATDDETRIRDAFRTYHPVGQQPRMVTLFSGLCAAAGLTADKVPSRQSVASAPSKLRPALTKSPLAFLASRSSSAFRSPSSPPNSLPPALAGLLASIPSASRGWTKADRDRFYAIFGTVLDFAIPIRTDAELKENGGQQ